MKLYKKLKEKFLDYQQAKLVEKSILFIVNNKQSFNDKTYKIEDNLYFFDCMFDFRLKGYVSNKELNLLHKFCRKHRLKCSLVGLPDKRIRVSFYRSKYFNHGKK